MKSWKIFAPVCLLMMAVIAAPTVVQAEGRVALVMGTSSYESVEYLPNATKDAEDVAASLRSLGFTVFDGYDLSRIEMLKLTQAFTQALAADDVALFYFSGHGIQIGTENFILPADASGADTEQLKETSISLQTVLRGMELRGSRSIVILDACRNNPFQEKLKGRSVGGASRGLARVDAGVGSYIAFSTQPGNIALDGSGRNSPFTAALLEHLSSPEDDLHEMMRKVRRDVVKSTNRSQIPWENSSLIERIYLGAPGGRLPAATVETSTRHYDSPDPFTHVVSGLDPQGDGFLALRNGTTRNAARIAKMRDGTRLEVFQQRGAWFNVRTEKGLVGWAHSNWITPVDLYRNTPRPTSATNTCEALWYERNAIFARNGYCFGSARGQAAFSNAGCRAGLSAGQIPLSQNERRQVAEIRASERNLGCR
ncbi:MAG: caspase family protein [Stappiaceae bacterium]